MKLKTLYRPVTVLANVAPPPVPHSALASASVLGAALYLAGCGGGASGKAFPSGGETSLQIGQANVSFFGKLSPQIAGGTNGVTVTSMAGASFSALRMVPSQTLQNTSIAYNGNGTTLLYANGAETPINGLSGGFFYDPCFTNDGHVVVTGFDPKSSTVQVFESNYDGSDLTKLTNSTHMGGGANVSWAPNGSKIAYDSSTGIYTSNTNGTDEKLLVAGAVQPAISPDSTQIAYSVSSGGVSQIFVQPIGGGAPAHISVSSFASVNNCYAPTWAPGGKWIAFSVDSDERQGIEVQTADAGPTVYDVPQASPDSNFDNDPVFSPDGTSLAFMRSSTYEGPGALMIASATGQSPILIASPDPSGLATPAWSPFPSSRLFVGTGGSMFTSANGFLWGQVGDVFASLVSFTVTTPSTATATLQGTSGNSGLVYDLHADSITGLKYTNGYYALTSTVIPNYSSAVTDALVSFNPANGQVNTMAPFLATRGVAKPLSKTNGNQLVFSGQFVGIWNSAGKNVAPSGASQVVIDRTTGKLVTFS